MEPKFTKQSLWTWMNNQEDISELNLFVGQEGFVGVKKDLMSIRILDHSTKNGHHCKPFDMFHVHYKAWMKDNYKNILVLDSKNIGVPRGF
jgi:hypothetical protein